MNKLIAVAITVAVFIVGAWQLKTHSAYLPNSSGEISWLQVASWLVVTFGLGTATGLALGGLSAGVARLTGRPLMPPFKGGYLLGLNLTAITVLWLAPALAA